MNDRLFCYGTLQDPRVLSKVAGVTPCYQAASLAGYARFLVRNADYPGIRAAPGEQVNGLLCAGISRAQWLRLDQFEGAFYRRVLVPVATADSHRVMAWAYVIRDHCLHQLTDQPWDFDIYQQRFVARLHAGYVGAGRH